MNRWRVNILRENDIMTGWKALDRIRAAVRSMPAYHDAHPNVELKLDQNENPYDFPAELKRKTVEAALTAPWDRYFPARPAELVSGLSALADWPAEGIIVGNGSNELLMATLVATAAAGGRVLTIQPSFLLYTRLSQLYGAEPVTVSLDDDLGFDAARIRQEITRTDPALVIICSPNNPTGSSIAANDLAAVLNGFSGIALVDEAYHEFSGGSFRSFLDRFDNLLLLRTFSKAMSLAGMRIGYLLGQAPLVSEIAKARLPFTLNPVSCQAALTTLAHQATFGERVKTIIDERERLMALLKQMHGITVYPSSANFILLKSPRADAVLAALLERGVLVRRLRGHPLLEDTLRVSVGTPEENDRFVVEFERALAVNA